MAILHFRLSVVFAILFFVVSNLEHNAVRGATPIGMKARCAPKQEPENKIINLSDVNFDDALALNPYSLVLIYSKSKMAGTYLFILLYFRMFTKHRGDRRAHEGG